MKTTILFILFSLAGIVAFSQGSSLYAEITKTDITLTTGFTMDKVSIFGIHLGMTAEEVINTLAGNNNLYYYEDKTHGTKDYRIYVYDTDETGKKKNCILYLIWTENRSELNRITVFNDFETYLQGNTKKLLSTEAVDSNSDFYKTHLGAPDSSAVTLDLPSIGYKHTTFYYPDKFLQVTLKQDGDKASVVFAIYVL
ncbi:MAG: hypothetical protein RB294_08570 [Bacteroidales bacterium]|jgi:hypothetical protein|nr:hypothetical protein [Bacteroidales bacterium]HPB03037.1 hypothetical protein [Bacteroidales bacterium]